MKSLFSLLLLLLPTLAFSAEAKLPNIILMYADDLGYGDLGCYGNTKIRTPNLDRLAKEGIRLTDFYSAQAVCSASRTALLTGCYPNRLGILGALNPNSKNGIHDQETTLGELLKSKGYATAIYGKWHLGHHPPFLPTRHGFDDYFGLPYSNDMWPKNPSSKFPPLPLIEGEKTIETNPDQSKLTTQYTERAVKFIESNQEKPFFLYLPHTMPHVPLFVSEKFKGKSKAGTYGDVIEELDWSMGEILNTLKKHHLEANTLVIFSSDNGPWLPYDTHAGSSGPLREGKGSTFEGGVRMPCLMRWPEKIPAGKVCKEPIMTIDVFPTLAHLTGATLPKLKIDGLDISPLLMGKANAASPHDALYFFWGRELQALRAGKWKLHFPHSYPVVTSKPKEEGKPGTTAQKKIDLSLFDLEADIAESVNLVEKEPEVVTRLQKLAEQMRQDLGDTLTKQEGKGVRLPGKVE